MRVADTQKRTRDTGRRTGIFKTEPNVPNHSQTQPGILKEEPKVPKDIRKDPSML
jgi:hypothetical protein